MQGNACKLPNELENEVDCIATEPDLGPALRQVPTSPYAEKIINKLKPMYNGFLQEAYRVLKKGGHLVFVAPYLRTRSGGPVTMPVEEKAKSIGFKKVYPFQENIFGEDVDVKYKMAEMASFLDFEKRHIVGREIFVFQK